MSMHKLLVQSEFRVRAISFINKFAVKFILILAADVYECMVSKLCFFLFCTESVADIADGSVADD